GRDVPRLDYQQAVDAPTLRQGDGQAGHAVEDLPNLWRRVGYYHQTGRFHAVQRGEHVAHEGIPLHGNRNATYVISQPVAVAGPTTQASMFGVVDKQGRCGSSEYLLQLVAD